MKFLCARSIPFFFRFLKTIFRFFKKRFFVFKNDFSFFKKRFFVFFPDHDQIVGKCCKSIRSGYLAHARCFMSETSTWEWRRSSSRTSLLVSRITISVGYPIRDVVKGFWLQVIEVSHCKWGILWFKFDLERLRSFDNINPEKTKNRFLENEKTKFRKKNEESEKKTKIEKKRKIGKKTKFREKKNDKKRYDCVAKCI